MKKRAKEVKKRKPTPEELYKMQQREPAKPEIKEIEEEPITVKTRMPLPKGIPKVIDLDKIVLEIDKRRQRKIKNWNSWYIGFVDGIFLIRHILDSTKED